MSAVDTTNHAFAAPDDAPSPRVRLAAVLALATLGDILLFGHAPGLAAVLFVAAVEIATVLASSAGRRRALICSSIGSATLAPLLEDANALSLAIAATGAATVALCAHDDLRGDFAARLLAALRFLGLGPLRILLDMPEVAPKALGGGIEARALVVWLLPLGLGGVFLALFSAANPIIEGWLSAIDPSWLLAFFDIRRLAFGLALAALVWPFLLFRRRAAPRVAVASVGEGGFGALLSLLFAKGAILRSLILFNAMFAVETALDIAILGRGGALPQGVSFAAYAHRGAYPLMATALLAGAFVIAAMRPGSDASRSKPIRALVYLWVGQNVALVVSSIYRLDLYVQAYSLTYWRVAAFEWMALVAIGLVLILVQMSTRRSNRWLLSANAAAAALALYLSAFVNFNCLIADYNLRHGGEPDTVYLLSLGPDALPAVDAALASPKPSLPSSSLGSLRSTLAAEPRDDDWRSLTFRSWRLSRYLAEHP